MLYHRLRFVNYLFTVLGIKKPFISLEKKPSKIIVWHKIWSLSVMIFIIAGYILTMKSGFTPSLKTSLKIICRTNDMIINVLIIYLNLLNREKLCSTLYEAIEKTLQDLNISESNIKMLVMKIYLLFIATTAIVIVFIILEIMGLEACVLLITLPSYLETFHLAFHLCLLLAILKLVTLNMSNMLYCDARQQNNNFVEEPEHFNKWKYLLSTDVRLFKMNAKENIDPKYLCKIYDDLATCLQLLEQYHGVQMLLTLWLMFSNGVFAITIIACKQAEFPLITGARSVLPFLWYFIGSFINEQISKQVEQIDMIIIKCLIDFRCHQTKKNILQTFKQLIESNRLQFTACGLFHLNYSTILGTAVNVITYSIILIQLFLDDS